MSQLYPFAQDYIQKLTRNLLTTNQYTPVYFDETQNRYVNFLPRNTKLSISEVQVQHIIKALAYYNQNVGPVLFDDFDGNSEDLAKMLSDINFDDINAILSTHGLTI